MFEVVLNLPGGMRIFIKVARRQRHRFEDIVVLGIIQSAVSRCVLRFAPSLSAVPPEQKQHSSWNVNSQVCH